MLEEGKLQEAETEKHTVEQVYSFHLILDCMYMYMSVLYVL